MWNREKLCALVDVNSRQAKKKKKKKIRSLTNFNRQKKCVRGGGVGGWEVISM